MSYSDIRFNRLIILVGEEVAIFSGFNYLHLCALVVKLSHSLEYPCNSYVQRQLYNFNTSISFFLFYLDRTDIEKT